MSKFNIGVGDDFPLDEDQSPRGGDHRHHHFHGHHHHGFRHHPMARHRHHRRGFGGFAMLLILAGLVALYTQHQLSATAAWGLVAAGAALGLIRTVLHWRFHRALAKQVS